MPGLNGFHYFLKNICQKSLRLRFVVPGILLLALLALTISDRHILHLNVDSLSPINEARRAEGKMLRNDVGFWYGGSMMLVTAPDKEEVLQYSEFLQPYLDDLVTDSVIEGYDMAAHFLPSVKTQQKNQQQLQDPGKIAENLATAMADTPFRPKVFEPFLDELAVAAQLPPLDIESLEKSIIGKKLSPLIFDFNDDSGGVILLHGVNDDARMKQFADNHDDLYYMHLKSASTDLVARSVDRVSVSILGCVLIIYISLGLAFRSFIRPLKIMIPTFSAALTTAAILVFSGNPLSIFHLISLLLVVGLGLDYALFFNRLPDNNEEWDTTFKSLWVCAITTILVFGILTFSNTPPLKAIGITVGIGAFLSMVFAAMWAACPDKKSVSEI
jgi:predicted exporter